MIRMANNRLERYGSFLAEVQAGRWGQIMKILSILVKVFLLPLAGSAVTLSYRVSESDLVNIPILVEHREVNQSIVVTIYIHRSGPFANHPESVRLVLRDAQNRKMFQGDVRRGSTLVEGQIGRFDFEIHRDLLANSDLQARGIAPGKITLLYRIAMSDLLQRPKGPLTGMNPVHRFFKEATFNTDAFFKKLEETLKRIPESPTR